MGPMSFVVEGTPTPFLQSDAVALAVLGLITSVLEIKLGLLWITYK